MLPIKKRVMLRKQHNPFLDFLNTGNRFTQLLCSFATARNYRYLNLFSPFEFFMQT
ncbi:hypothetical protein MNBD_BACTEROID01-2664 [hydrothermal vent metagenome]|uniref:Uncharacterized protein n=1 Tax=hydrothermal vent metagenome TaxID=652676 RepID=A0A3B0THY5_9ZZZZ